MPEFEGEHQAGEPGKVDTVREVIFGADGQEMYPGCECVCCDCDCWLSLCCACAVACGNMKKYVNLRKMRNSSLGKGADEVNDQSLCCFCSICWSMVVPMLCGGIGAAATAEMMGVGGVLALMPFWSCSICCYRQKLAEQMEFVS